jgi:hypothetical protein
MNSRNTILDAASLLEPGSNPKVEHKSRGFLRELNAGGATPLEQLSPKEARDLLARSSRTRELAKQIRSISFLAASAKGVTPM